MRKLDELRGLGVLVLTGLFTLGLLGSPVPVAEAGHISCGDTLGPGGSFVLDSNVGPCGPTGPALRVVGPVQFDLNGFTVSCTTSGQIGLDGIVVGGNAATVTNGTVTNCFAGVVVAGSGRQRIQRVTADGNGNGFYVQSSGNWLHRNTAVNHRATGYFIYAAGVQLKFNLLSDNRADSNGIGIYLSTDARNSIVFRNTALSNSSTDMRDDNPNCDRNFWLRNTFVTSSQGCIR
ncbi:MAG: hypothetical protein HY725_06250 [Candidatus Rokubacteria bacterium]|nr:hypothetical protein [Candidatus Rokubacteria bacterium]